MQRDLLCFRLFPGLSPLHGFGPFLTKAFWSPRPEEKKSAPKKAIRRQRINLGKGGKKKQRSKQANEEVKSERRGREPSLVLGWDSCLSRAPYFLRRKNCNLQQHFATPGGHGGGGGGGGVPDRFVHLHTDT